MLGDKKEETPLVMAVDVLRGVKERRRREAEASMVIEHSTTAQLHRLLAKLEKEGVLVMDFKTDEFPRYLYFESFARRYTTLTHRLVFSWVKDGTWRVTVMYEPAGWYARLTRPKYTADHHLVLCVVEAHRRAEVAKAEALLQVQRDRFLIELKAGMAFLVRAELEATNICCRLPRNEVMAIAAPLLKATSSEKAQFTLAPHPSEKDTWRLTAEEKR